MTCVYKENEDNIKMVEEEVEGVGGRVPDGRMRKFLASRRDSLHPQVGKILRLGLEFEEGG